MFFYCSNIYWDAKKNEINFQNGFLSNGRGKRFQVDNLKRIIPRGQSLYLCKVKVKTGNHEDITFKFFGLDESDMKNFSKDDIQKVGTNNSGKFVFDKEFEESIRKNTKMDKIEKISLSGM